MSASNPFTAIVSANLPIHAKQKLAALADAHGVSTHALHVRILLDYVANTPLPDHPAPNGPEHTRMTEYIVVELILPQAQRLHSAARQLRDMMGAPLKPAALARQLVQHVVERPSDLPQQIAKFVDPNYIDIVPYAAAGPTQKRLRKSGLKVWFPLNLKMSWATRQALDQYCADRGTTIAQVLRKAIDDYLPELPLAARAQADTLSDRVMPQPAAAPLADPTEVAALLSDVTDLLGEQS